MGRQDICHFAYTCTFSKFEKFAPKKRVNRDILNLKYYIFGVSIHRIGIISQFSYTICLLYTLSMGKAWFNITKNWIILLHLYLKHIHKVKFYPSGNNFTQALLVMLVTNIISDVRGDNVFIYQNIIIHYKYLHKTRNQMRVAIESGKGMKVKVLK